jgi:hypothetical protein
MSKSEEGSSPNRQAPINLTAAAADGMTWREPCNTLWIDSKGQAAHLRIQPLDDDEEGAVIARLTSSMSSSRVRPPSLR